VLQYDTVLQGQCSLAPVALHAAQLAMAEQRCGAERLRDRS
jgi:hypothetical protein